MGYVEGIESKLLIVLRVDMTHQSSSFFQNVHQSTSVVVSKKGRPCPWLPSHPVLRHWVCAQFTCHSRKKLRTFHWRKKLKTNTQPRYGRTLIRPRVVPDNPLSEQLPNASNYHVSCLFIQKWAPPCTRACVLGNEAQSTCIHACNFSLRACTPFFVGNSCTYSAYIGDRWWVSLISTSQHVHLHLHLRLHYIYIYIYLYYCTASFKHETSHFLAWHDQPVSLLAPHLSQSASGTRVASCVVININYKTSST